MKRKILFGYLLFLIVGCLFTSCSLDFPPEDEVSDPDAITSIIAAERTLAAAYASYHEHEYALDIVTLSDDLVPSSLLARNVGLKNSYYWNETALIPLAKSIWEGHYETIAKVNVLLERLPNVPLSNDSDREKLANIKAQAQCLKALCYFQLLKIFCPAFHEKDKEEYGLLLKEGFTLTEQQQRVSRQLSVDEINKLLSSAEHNLTEGKLFSKDALSYLKAEVALWAGENEKALTFASTLYDKFKKNVASKEVLEVWTNHDSPLRVFALDLSKLAVRPYTQLEYEKEIGDFLVVNSSISYDKKDVRNSKYAVPFSIGANNTFLLGKYNEQGKHETSFYYTKYRMASLFFLCAEAHLKLGNKAKALEIITELETIRRGEAIKLLDVHDFTLEQLLLFKQREFVGEPERFFDLKRNAKEVRRYNFGASYYAIESSDYRWTLPIPLSEKRHNKIITQNKGWEHINNVD